MRIACTLSLLLTFATTLHSADSIPGVKLPPQKNDFAIFILAGQSNMAGRGHLDEVAKRPVENLFSINRNGKWQPALDPLHWDKPAAGVGMGRYFAEDFLALLSSSTTPSQIYRVRPSAIGLVPTACGGSPISTWLPGAYHDQTKSHPYDDFLTRSRSALEQGALQAILWHQGESDCTPKDAPLYEQRLTELIERMRKDLNAPGIPFIIGQMGEDPAKPWNAHQKAVDAAQQAVAKKIKNVAFVRADGLHLQDGVHFDTASLREFASRYATAYVDLFLVRKKSPVR